MPTAQACLVTTGRDYANFLSGMLDYSLVSHATLQLTTRLP